MDNQNNDPNGKQPHKKNLIQEDIPLWLQGLEEHKFEDTSPIETEKLKQDVWIKESEIEADLDADLTPPPKKQQDRALNQDQENENNEHEESLPDWLNDLSEVDPAAPTVQLSNISKEKKPNSTEQIRDNDAHPKKEEEKMQPPLPKDESSEESKDREIDPEESTKNNEFVEISDFGFEQEPESFDASENGQNTPDADDDDLPEWLNQMISADGSEKRDPSKIAQPQETDEAILDDTQPVNIKPGKIEKPDFPQSPAQTVQDENLPLDDPNGELPRAPTLLFHGNGKAVHPRPEPANAAVKEKDQPAEEEGRTIIPPTQTPKDEKTQQEDIWLTEPEFESIPEPLVLAKELLQHGETNQAIEILQSYVEKSLHLDLIENWLLKISKRTDQSNSQLWEIIGDLKQAKRDPQKAFQAYSHAIHLLLKEKRSSP